MPSVATGRLPTDPEPGTPEWDAERRRHDELAARLAKLHQMRSRIPAEIRDCEFRLRESRHRLGLEPIAPTPHRRSRTVGVTAAQQAALDCLPARVSEVAKALGLNADATHERLAGLRDKGLVTKDPGYGAIWRRVGEDTP